MNTLMLLGQMLGGATRVWLEFGFLISLFAVLIFKPERIRKLSLFQAACGLLALSMIIPHLLVFAVDLNPSAGLGSRSMGGANVGVDLTSKIVMLAGPVTFAIAFLCATFSLMPDATKTSTAPPATD